MTTTNPPNYSFIIPHKNSVDLLKRCLDSIPRRDDVEIIVVDDNSSLSNDEQQKMESYRDARTQVIFTKEGRGAGYARNVGIDHAKGEWILFADADDYFYSEGLNTLLNNSVPPEYDVILYGSKYVFTSGEYFWYGDYSPQTAGNDILPCNDITPLYRQYVTPWAKMVRRKLLVEKEIQFEEIPCSNDEMFSTRVALSIQRYGRINLLVYHHERNNKGLMETTDWSNFMIRWNAYIRKERLLKKKGRNIMDSHLLSFDIFKSHYSTLLLCAARECVELGIKKGAQDYRHFCKKYGVNAFPYYTKCKKILIKALKNKN